MNENSLSHYLDEISDHYDNDEEKHLNTADNFTVFVGSMKDPIFGYMMKCKKIKMSEKRSERFCKKENHE